MTVIPDRRYTSALAREIPPPTAAVRKVTGKNARPPGASVTHRNISTFSTKQIPGRPPGAPVQLQNRSSFLAACFFTEQRTGRPPGTSVTEEISVTATSGHIASVAIRLAFAAL